MKLNLFSQHPHPHIKLFSTAAISSVVRVASGLLQAKLRYFSTGSTGLAKMVARYIVQFYP